MGSLMFISFDELLTDYAKDHDLHDLLIVVASREICGSLNMRSAISGVSTGITYESKYDNIEFVDSIRPTASTMEYAFGGNYNSFIEMYSNHLIGAIPFTDLCCVADIVVNEDCNVAIVMAAFEHSAHIPNILRDFIEEEFKIRGYIYSDLKVLSDNYGSSKYGKIVESLKFDVPDTFTGRNFDAITKNFVVPNETLESVKENLEAQKIIAANMNARPEDEDNLESIFFNRLTEDIEDKVRAILENKPIEMIKELCRQKKIRISPGASKEFLVDKLMRNIVKESTRVIEYTN